MIEESINLHIDMDSFLLTEQDSNSHLPALNISLNVLFSPLFKVPTGALSVSKKRTRQTGHFFVYFLQLVRMLLLLPGSQNWPQVHVCNMRSAEVRLKPRVKTHKGKDMH